MSVSKIRFEYPEALFKTWYVQNLKSAILD